MYQQPERKNIPEKRAGISSAGGLEKIRFQKAIIGNSPQMKQVYMLMGKTAGNNINVSITGETGTGKDLIARSIHFNSEGGNSRLCL